jgi:hypothetical protein
VAKGGRPGREGTRPSHPGGIAWISNRRGQRAWRDEVRAFLRENVTPELLGEKAERGFEHAGGHLSAFRKKVGAKDWWGLNWPKEYGGLGLGPVYQHILVNEFEYFGVPGPDLTVTSVAPMIMRYGTRQNKEQNKEEFLPPIDSPGIEVRPLITWDDFRTNETLFTSVRVPRTNLIGEVNCGWQYLTGALDLERGALTNAGDLRRAVDEVIAAAPAPGSTSGRTPGTRVPTFPASRGCSWSTSAASTTARGGAMRWWTPATRASPSGKRPRASGARFPPASFPGRPPLFLRPGNVMAGGDGAESRTRSG